MAITAATSGDYINLGYNILPCVPKSGYTPVKGNLVIRETAQNNEVDVCANTENPFGIVVTVGPGTTPAICGVAQFVPGVTVVLPTAAAIALGTLVRADAGGMVAVGETGVSRTRVEANAGGVGKVISVGGSSPNFTATVAF